MLTGRTGNDTAAPAPRDIFHVAGEKRASVLWVAGVISLAAIALALALPSLYSSTTVIVPSPEPISVWTPTDQVGATPSAAVPSLSSLSGSPNSAAGVLQSRAVRDQIIRRFNLASVYGRQTLSDTEETLDNYVRIDASPVGTVSITITDHSPQRATGMANAFVEEFNQRNGVLARTLAAQRHAFFQRELASETPALLDAEAHLKRIQEGDRIINPKAQLRASLRSIAEISAALSMLEVEEKSLRVQATSENADVVTLLSEERALRTKLNQLEKNPEISNEVAAPNSLLSPSTFLEYSRAYREVAFHRLLIDFLNRQADTALLDQKKSAAPVRVAEPATIPDDEIGPPRLAIASAGSLLGLFLGICQSVVRKGIHKRMRRNTPANSQTCTAHGFVS